MIESKPPSGPTTPSATSASRKAAIAGIGGCGHGRCATLPRRESRALPAAASSRPRSRPGRLRRSSGCERCRTPSPRAARDARAELARRAWNPTIGSAAKLSADRRRHATIRAPPEARPGSGPPASHPDVAPTSTRTRTPGPFSAAAPPRETLTTSTSLCTVAMRPPIAPPTTSGRCTPARAVRVSGRRGIGRPQTRPSRECRNDDCRERAAQRRRRDRPDHCVHGDAGRRRQAAWRPDVRERIHERIEIEECRHDTPREREIGIVRIVRVGRRIRRIGSSGVEDTNQRREQPQRLAGGHGIEAVHGDRRPRRADRGDAAHAGKSGHGAQCRVPCAAVRDHSDVRAHPRHRRQHAPQPRGLTGNAVRIRPRGVAVGKAARRARAKPDRPHRRGSAAGRRNERLGRQSRRCQIDRAIRGQRSANVRQDQRSAVAVVSFNRDEDERRGGRAAEMLAPRSRPALR